MGKIKYIDKIRTLLSKSPVISLTFLKNILGDKYAYLLLHNMVKKKEIYRITRGFYSHHEDPTVSVFCFKPAYLGLQNALSVHALWEQETNIIILTTKTVREGVRRICESNVLIRRIPKNLFFGIEYKQYGEFYVPVSDIEKTFLDLIYLRQPVDEVLLRVFRGKIDRQKLDLYLMEYDERFRKRVLESLSKAA
jgi:hypothetical protein